MDYCTDDTNAAKPRVGRGKLHLLNSEHSRSAETQECMMAYLRAYMKILMEVDNLKQKQQ